jgi:AcrR family transcriptional regulator
MQLFGVKGYNSTSIADILQAAEAHSGSLYHFFGTKQDLLLGVLELYRDGIEPMLLSPAWEHVSDPIDRVFALLASYRRALELTDCTYGCPIGSLALELHEPDPPVREMLAVNFLGWVRHVRACLTTMEGGVMQSRTHRSLTAFDASVAMLRDYFNRLESDARR